jgi:hypothetical protein
VLLTNQQKFLLDVLERLECVRERQLVSLIRPAFCRRRPDIASVLVTSSMRQLMRGNFNIHKEGDVFLRRNAETNPALLEAVDVMLELSSDALSSYRTAPPALLRFSVQEDKSLAAFLVARYGDDPARMELNPEERIILLFDGRGRPTPLLVPNKHFFAVRLETGKHRFFALDGP